jgi:hypothetical protein
MYKMGSTPTPPEGQEMEINVILRKIYEQRNEKKGVNLKENKKEEIYRENLI